MLNKFIEKFKKEEKIILKLKVKPSVSKTEVKEILSDDTIKIDIAVPPINNKANIELIKFLSNKFHVDVENIKIIGGKKEKNKLIKLIKY